MRIIAFIVCSAVVCLAAPSVEEKAVLAAVQQFFNAMEARDAAAGRAVVLPDGRYYAIREGAAPAGSTLLEFVDRLPSRKERLLERMFNPAVHVRGNVAAVWTAYDFHRDGKFSHCGIDAFTLVKAKDGWKIASLVYTVEPAGCPERPAGVDQGFQPR